MTLPHDVHIACKQTFVKTSTKSKLKLHAVKIEGKLNLS